MVSKPTYEELEQRVKELEKEAFKQKADAEKRFRAFFNQSPNAIVMIDPETTLPIEFNDRITKLLGYSRTEFAKLPAGAI